MYRLLIVDDEPIIVEGLTDFLSEQLSGLELVSAYSAREALDVLRAARIDIVLTDIEMPRMNGLALQQEINRYWPRCKVIFLTGYNSFEYIQTSSRHGALDYVLKTEGDAQIVETVRKAVSLLDEELAAEQLLHKAESRLSQALPLLQRDFLLDLLQGTGVDAAADPDALNEQLGELRLPLRADRPLLMAMGRVDVWREEMRHADRMLFMYAIQNIAEEYLADSFQLVQIRHGNDRFVWLLQLRSGDAASSPVASSAASAAVSASAFSASDPVSTSAPSAAAVSASASALPAGIDPVRRLSGYTERIQSACRQYLKLVCSFVLVGEPFPWARMALRFDTLSFLFARGLGASREVVLFDQQLVEGFREQSHGRVVSQTVRMLDDYLEQGRRADFFELYGQLMGMIEGRTASRTGAAVEIFYALVAMFVAYINRYALMKAVAERLNVNRLFNVEEHQDWQETTERFRLLAGLLFEQISDETEQQTNEVVRIVHAYIKENIGGDLSLTKLSEQAYLSPSYLSKLFKQATGQSVTDFILDSRVQKAKELLLHSELKIHQVAKAVGFESAAYFTRCFRKLAGVNPQAFRDGSA